MSATQGQARLPGHASVIVIGGGIMGCSTLYHLAKEGVTDAILLERNQLTSGTTWHSAAQVRALRSTRNLTDLIRYSISLYSTLEHETGQATGWINKGSLSIATQPDRLIHIRRQEALAHLFGVEAQSISVGEAKERWPLMNTEDVIGAVWSPGDGRVSPSDLCAALTKGARQRGAAIFEDTAVIGILTEGNKVVGVETPSGQIRCDAIALCTGLWSRRNAQMAGVDIPVWPCEHYYLLTKPVEGIVGNLPSLSDHDHHLYIRDDSGGLLIGCFEPHAKSIPPELIGEHAPFNLLPEDWTHFEPMMINAMHRLPCLQTAEVRMLLNGPESFTPDGSFLLGESAETRGFFLGCGMNSVGVATGGGAGMALAQIIVRGRPPADLHEVDPKRFLACFNSVAALAARAPEVLGKHYAITYPGYQWDSARNLRRSPLQDQWRNEKPHLGQFGGWERPLYFHCDRKPTLRFNRPEWFEQVGREVRQAHEQAALFDQSTFGKIRVEGPDAEAFLNRVCANDMSKPVGRVVYTAMLNEHGGVESDLTSFRLGDECYRLYVGTTAVKRDIAWLGRHLTARDRVRIRDETETYAVIGLMGPDTADVALRMGAGELNNLPYFHHTGIEIAGIRVRAARLSYVGEAGWELTCRAEDAPALYGVIRAEGVCSAGLFAQTSMRIEKRYLSFGHDLDTGINPLQAGLGFAVDWNSDFIGRTALLRAKETISGSHIVSVLLDDDRGCPLGNEPVYHDGALVGQTTSAAFGYRVGKPVALVHLNISGKRLDGASVQVDIARQLFESTIVCRPVFDPDGQRMRV